MDTNIKAYNEKYFYKKDSVPYVETLIDKEICDEKDGNVIFKVTGIYIIKSKIYAIFPCGYKIEDSKKDTILLLDLFAVLQKEEKLNPVEYKDIEIEYEGKGKLISTAYKIINDYRENGYLQINHIIEGENIGGRINWKKTIKLNKSIINDEGMPVYTNVISRHNSVNQDALLRSIHIYSINMSIALFGFLFGIDSEFDKEDINLPAERNYILYFLKQEKQKTFNTRFVRIIDLIIEFIESSEEESNSEITAGVATKTFYSVWEIMCKNVFKDEYRKYAGKIPKPYWKDSKGNISYTEQIPDIIYKEGKTLYILDAKYYNVKKNKPRWHDLVKQYFYEMSLKAVIKDISFTYNAMIIPGSVENKIFEFWAFSRVENVHEFGQIIGIKADTKTIIKDFCYGGRNDYRSLLNECLEIIVYV